MNNAERLARMCREELIAEINRVCRDTWKKAIRGAKHIEEESVCTCCYDALKIVKALELAAKEGV